MKSYIIHFIRHGMTEANVKGQYAGSWDIPISDKGKEKLQALKDTYEYPSAQEYYSSPLSRCVDTCKIIYPEIDPIIIDGLKECDFGDWEGKTTEELSSNPEYLEWIKSSKIAPPNGESWEDFHKRISASFEDIVTSLMKRGVTSAAIFTHGGVIMSLLAMYGIPKAKPFDWMVDNGCGYSIRITPGLWMRDKVFEVYQKVPLGSNEEISGEFKNLIDNLKDNN